jgi:prophage tail gpP-like protein
MSNSGNFPASTVDPKLDGQGGQFLNQSFAQIATAIGQKIDVNVLISGSPPNADKIFDRVQIYNGQDRLSFLARLAPMRNLHATDDEQGNLVFARPDGSQPSGFSLVEGQNILEVRAILQNNLAVPQYEVKGQQPGTDESNGPDAAQSIGTAWNSNYTGPPRPFVIMAEHTADDIDCTLRAQHEMQTNNMHLFDIVVTVQGWLTPAGDLWFDHLGQTISVLSPMIFPTGSTWALLIIKGVKTTQDSQHGTRTELQLTLQQSLGSGATAADVTPPGASGPTNAPPATPAPAPTPAT